MQKPISIAKFEESLAGLLSQTKRPAVIYSGIFAIAQAFDIARRELPTALATSLLKVLGPKRTMLMPAYTNGFKNGRIDLDQQPGNTGMINEIIRKMPGTHRTASAFFSFVTRGPLAAHLAALRPQDAWGAGSVFEWLQNEDADIVMLGVPWEMCSFLHRAEWLAQVPYRYVKQFQGEMISGSKTESLQERLYVRSLAPVVENAWPGLEKILTDVGMKTLPLGHSQLAAVNAKALIEAVLKALRNNPFVFVKDSSNMRSYFSKKQ